MAKAVTDEQLQLRRRARRRLVGAIALVTVIAVVLPWVLDSEPQPAGPDVSVQIPPTSTGEFAPRVAPGAAATSKGGPETKGASESKGAPEARATPDPGTAAESRPAGQAAKPTPERRPAEPAAGPETLEAEQQRSLTPPLPRNLAGADKGAPKVVTRPAEKATDKAAPKAREPVPDTRAAAKSGDGRSYIVQVGALADADKAKAIQQQLAAKGMPSYVETLETPKGMVTRVRVGPFPSRDVAEQSRERLKSLGFEGNVAPR